MEEKIYGYDESFNKVRVLPYEAFGIRQLLVNPDFKVNQRGKSEYTGQGVYSLDMWQIHAVNGNTISQLESGYGVLINKTKKNQTVLRQYHQYATREDIGKQFTCCYDFESDVAFTNEIGFGKQRVSLQVEQGRKRYSHTFTLNESDFEDNDVLCFLVFNNTQDNVQLKVYNADLFEGDVAYPHVKNKYVYDLIECQRKIRKFNTILSTIFKYSDKRFLVKAYFEPLDNTPTIKVGDVGGYRAINGSLVIATKKEISTLVNGAIILIIEFDVDIQEGVDFWTDIEISCEPL